MTSSVFQAHSDRETKPMAMHHSAIIKKILYLLLYMAVSFLLGRIRILPGISPFGPAFIAACFASGRFEVLAVTAGVSLGALLVPGDSLYIVSVSLMVCGALLAAGQSRRWVAVVVTACAYTVGAIVFKTQDLETFMTAVLECLMALVMIYVIGTLIQIATRGKKRTLFSTEETICLSLGALIAICMFGTLNFMGVYVADVIAMLLVLGVAYTGGAALGAGVGLVAGIALCFGISADLSMVAMLGMAGLAAGTLRRLKKAGTAAGFMMTVLMVVIALTSMPVWHLLLIEAAAAAAIFCALPKKLFVFAGKYIDIKTRREFEYGMHTKRFKELTVGRLKEVSQVFLQTGEMFARDAEEKIHDGADISGVLALVAESTCKDCVFKKSCWDKDFLSTYSVLSRLLTAYEKKGSLDESCLDPAFVKKCYNVKGILAAAENVFSSYLVSLKWQKKIEESRVVTGRQLKGVAKVVSDIGKEMDAGFKFVEHMEERIAVALDAESIRAREVCAESVSGQLAVSLKVKSCGGGTDCSRGIERTLSGVCGVRMQKTPGSACSSNAYCTLRFEQARKFGILTGIAMAAKETVSGDCHAFEGLRDGRYLLMICDGMGSGENARRESAAAVSLVENFYQAGFDDAIIFDTINRLLILKSSEEMFTTVDLCVVDLQTGDARFTKIGAECSYILSRDGVTTVTPGSLPIGILEEVTPVRIHKTLERGDMIVMMSDGAAAAVKDDTAKWFADIPQDGAQAAADAILQKALGGGPVHDDMTVMVSQIIDG